MINQKLLTAILLLSVWLGACTPKTTETTTSTTPPTNTTPPPSTANLSPCPKFSDAPNPDEVETNYVLYRDFLRVNDWKQAYSYWKKVYNVAPAADGQRNTVLADGIRFYEHFLGQTKDSSYVDSIFMMYDQIEECYKEGGYVPARKAFDLFYKYPGRATMEEIYALFKRSIDEDGMKTNDFVINPFASLLVALYDTNKINQAEAQKYAKLLLDIVDHGVENCEGKACDRWAVIKEYTPTQLEFFEPVKGFFDCQYYIDKYYPEFVESPQDCDVIRTVYSRLQWGGCGQTHPELAAVAKAGNEHCVEATASGPVASAYKALQDGEYRRSIELFEQAAANAETATQKGNYLLTIAKIYYAHLKNYSRSRQYALRAAEARGGWGEPYILIGRLYASSGPLCGSGRGWESQVVVWPAIDMWNRAKSVDGSVAAEANKWIGRYAQYMPSREDIFIRNLSEGSSYYVGCWIQANTTIRAAR